MSDDRDDIDFGDDDGDDDAYVEGEPTVTVETDHATVTVEQEEDD